MLVATYVIDAKIYFHVDWMTLIVAKVSPWLDLDNCNPLVRQRTEKVRYCVIMKIFFPTLYFIIIKKLLVGVCYSYIKLIPDF